MRNKAFCRLFALVLCCMLCLGHFFTLTGMAYADTEASATPEIVIQITPPSKCEGGSAPVEIRVTDSAGTEFQSVQAKR